MDFLDVIIDFRCVSFRKYVRNWVAWAGNGVVRSEIGYNNVEHMDESF